MKILFLTLPLFFFYACTDKQALVKQLEAEVIQIHDEVMPKKADINRVGRQLKVIKQDSTLDESTVLVLNKQIEELAKAEASMDDWMAGYKAPSEDDPFEESMAILNQEKVKITAVKDLMLSSLDNGKNLLIKLSPQEKTIEQ